MNFNKSKSCLKNNFRVYSAECFYNSLKENLNSLYLTIGRDYAWSYENIPPTPSLTISDDIAYRKDIIFFKKIQIEDISFIIPRVEWEPNKRYKKYNVLNNETNCVITTNYISEQKINVVYLCIASPDNTDTVQLSSKQPCYNLLNPIDYIYGDDNYTWVMLYELSDQELYKFSTVNWIPIPFDGREKNLQNIVMKNSYKRTYPYYNFYNNTDDTVPLNGYGYNSLYELSAYHLLVSINIMANEEKITPNTSYRQIGLMSNPIEKISGKKAKNKTYKSNEIDLSTGQVLYFENRLTILKKTTQLENVQIILGF